MQVRKLWTFLCQPVTVSKACWQVFLMGLFFFSGVSCLLYQLMWQRLLYQIFGLDLISMTIIISVFMFGLGMGGLLGGFLADKFSQHLLMLYVAIEVAISGFGFLSPHLISLTEFYCLSPSLWTTMLGAFLLLSIPTFFMGATFPILVVHVFARVRNVGMATGSLYFINTLGGAVGVYLGGFVLLSTLTISQVIYQTATLNLLIAFSAFLLFRPQS